MRISDWSSDVCSSDLIAADVGERQSFQARRPASTRASGMSAFLRIERMLITRGANVLYDEPFHAGVNIIHGSNGSGKSTLADFIYFGLGGDLREWKESASRAERVYLQILTRSEEHTSELQSLMRTSYAVFCLKKK